LRLTIKHLVCLRRNLVLVTGEMMMNDCHQ
jgi:hypothetical protein